MLNTDHEYIYLCCVCMYVCVCQPTSPFSRLMAMPGAVNMGMETPSSFFTPVARFPSPATISAFKDCFEDGCHVFNIIITCVCV